MPWKDSSVMDERLRFIARVLDGERMSDVCRAFSISRKTGYKLLNRYRSEGPIALCDRSRRRVRYANQLPEQVERLIIEARKASPTGVLARSVSCWYDAWQAMTVCLPPVRSMRRWTAMGWYAVRDGDDGTELEAQPCRRGFIPTISGVPTSRASFGRAIGTTAIR